MKKWIPADVIFEPIGGEFERLVIFVIVLAVIVLFATALLLFVLKRKGRK